MTRNFHEEKLEELENNMNLVIENLKELQEDINQTKNEDLKATLQKRLERYQKWLTFYTNEWTDEKLSHYK